MNATGSTVLVAGPADAVSEERIAEQGRLARDHRRRIRFEAAAIIVAWLVGWILFRRSVMPLLPAAIISLGAIFKRVDMGNDGKAEGRSFELATEEQSFRYWSKYRFRRRGQWFLIAVVAFGCIGVHFMPEEYELGILLSAAFVMLGAYMVVGLVAGHCPRCLNSISMGEVAGRCEKCGVFFRTERKSASGAA